MFSEYFDWKRDYRAAWPDMELFPQIRGYHKSTGRTFCPVTAVTYINTGIVFGAGDWESAARVIGLPVTTAYDIARAADAMYYDGYDEVRKSLEEALGVD